MPTGPNLEIVDDVLHRWQADLLDLTRANKLLHIGSRASGVVQLQRPDSVSLLKLLQSPKRQLKFYQPPSFTAPLFMAQDDEDGPPTSWTPPRPPGRDELIADLDPNRLENALNRLRLRSSSLMREQGIQTLFVAFGKAKWTATSRDEEYISPLLLVPVRLDRARALDPHTLSGAGQNPIINPALLQRLAMIIGADVSGFDADDANWDLDLVAGQLTSLARSLPSWRVEADSAVLGLFSFAKYAMYADLERSHARFREHPLIQAVAGAGGDGLVRPAKVPDVAELDTTCSARTSWQILDADSSQQETIAWASAGASFVVQGPPGTGKSQTIANIVGEALGQGRTVLFVSEKLAALRIVSNRLEACGLGPFLLEAHGSDEDRRAVYQDISRTWQEQRSPLPARLASLDLLDDVRSRLSAYALALHDAGTPLGISAYQAVTEMARLANGASLQFTLDRPAQLTEQRREDIRESIRHLALVEQVVRQQDYHPWRGYRPAAGQGTGDGHDHQLVDDLTTIAARSRDLMTLAPGIAAAYGAEVAMTVVGLQRLADLVGMIARSTSLPGDWQERSERQALHHLQIAGQELLAEYQSKQGALLCLVDEQLLQANLEKLLFAVGSAPRAAAHLVSQHTSPLVAIDHARSELQPKLAEFQSALAQLRNLLSELAACLDIACPQSPAQADELKVIAIPLVANLQAPTSWLDSSQLAEVDRLLGEAAHRSNEIRRASDRLTVFFSEQHLSILDEADVRQQLVLASQSRLSQFLPAYRKAMKRVRNAARQPEQMPNELARDLVAEAYALQQNQIWFQANHATLARIFGHFYQGSSTDWKEVRHGFDQVCRVVNLVPNPIPPRLAALLTEPVPIEVSTAFSGLERSLDHVEALATQVIVRTSLMSQMRSSWQSVEFAALEDRVADIRAQLGEVWDAIGSVRATSVAGSIEADQIEQVIRDAMAVSTLRTKWSSAAEVLASRFGPLFDPEQSGWTAIEAELDLADRIADWFDGSPPACLVDMLPRLRETASADYAALMHAATEICARSQRVEDRFQHGHLPGVGRPLTETHLPQVIEWADALVSQAHRLSEWKTFLRAKQRAEVAGIGGVIAALQRSSLPAGTWLDSVERRVLEAWLTWLRSQNDLLVETEIALLPDRVGRFRQLDKDQWKLAPDRIRERVVRGFPDPAMAKTRMGKRTAAGILAHEVGKRQRHLPLRRFFSEHAQFVASVKPCWLMSPLAVAQHLGDSDLEFDLVVFDEASQILPADAIGAIGRGKQVIVVGDPEQLPPTRFFTGATMSPDDVSTDVPESILDACREILPMRTLNWHYRSRYEQLIAFSNAHFYDNRLLSLPSTDADVHPISLVHVPGGVYDVGKSRTNRVEARQVADAVIAYRKKHPRRSLGIVTFSEPQMMAVQFEIDSRKRLDASLENLLCEAGAEGFFIKNLENVQGDERDVIFFSVGYGPDKHGSLSHNFGPLNRAGGERRLNVAITRAREEVVIFASFLPEQIDEGKTSSRGLRLLKAYLACAARGEGAPALSEDGNLTDPFILSVARTLEAHGLVVETGHGVSAAPIDVVVKDPRRNRYVLAIESDGKTYNRLPTVRDRERLRAEMLERLGWSVYQIRSLRWLDDRREVLGDILHLASQVLA